MFNSRNEDTHAITQWQPGMVDQNPEGVHADNHTVAWVDIPVPARSSGYVSPGGGIELTLRLWNWRVDAVELIETPQVCYLDFSGYTAPAGHGSPEQIAADVKASVAGKFTQQSLTFYTSFDGITPDPDFTSTITLGGSDPTPTRPGYSPYDPGNTNHNDAGFVYTDQALFASIPTNGTEYTNMLANVTSHEVGHLLGYSLADAAGMGFMLNGDAMEARIRREMLLGEVGQVTQQRMTFVVETDYDPTAPLPPITYMPKTSATPDQRGRMMQEMEDFYRDAGGDGLADLERAWCTVADVEGVLDTLITRSSKLGPFFDVGYLLLQLNDHPEDVESFFGAIVLGDKPDELNLDGSPTFIQPEWNETLEGYIFHFDGLTEAEILGSDISLTFLATTDDINDFTLRALEANLTDLGSASFVVRNVPVLGDSHGNGLVDSADLAIWQQHYDPLGLNDNTFDMGDWNGDGLIDSTDLAMWQQHYDPLGVLGGVAVTTVPEPATLCFLAIGGLVLIRRKRK